MKKFLKLLFPYSLVFFETRVYSTFTVTDIFLILLLFSALFSKIKSLYYYPGRKTWLVMLSCFFVISLLGVLAFQRRYFLMSVYINSEFRIVFYGLSLLLIPRLFSTEGDMMALVKGLTYTLLIFSLFGLLDFISIKLGLGIQFNLSFRTEYVDQDRLRGLVAEPAHYGVFVGLVSSLVFCFFNIERKRRMPVSIKLILSFAIFMIILSQSMVGISFAIVLLIPAFLSYYRSQPRKRRTLLKITIPIALVLIIVILYTLNAERLGTVFAMEDASANQRFLGTWTLPIYGLDMYNSLLWGLGTGQTGSFLAQSGILTEGMLDADNLTLSNTLSMIFLQNGILGLTFFLFFLYFFFRKRSFFLFVIALLYCFSICEYGALLWSFLVLSESILNKTTIRCIALNQINTNE